MDGRLRDLCQKINLYTLGAYVDDEYKSERPKIERTADQLSHDCPLCRLFLDPRPEPDAPLQEVKSVQIESYGRQGDDDADSVFSELIAWLRSWKPRPSGIEYYPLSRIKVSVDYATVDWGPIPFTLDILADEVNDKIERYVGGRIVPATDSDTSLHQVGDWLAKCLKDHSLCKVGLSGRKFNDDPAKAALPDRVIHVGGPVVEPRLVQTAGKRGRYTALSYCWEPMDSGEEPFKLLSSNLAGLQEHLPLAKLPASIRDAIDFTRRLGISYIWIDRLCIIQDDKEDWKGHAAQMCNIYAIAAVAAKTRDEGLYYTPPERPGVRIKCATHEKEVGYMRVVRRASASSALERELELSKWNTRGWVMQERLMARRIVYFGRTQILWECQQMSRAQDSIADFDGLQKSELYWDFRWEGLRKQLQAVLPFVVAKSAGPDFWYPILKDYTSRDLTYPDKDKEKAMAGAGEAICSRLRMKKYAYGIFLDRIDWMLLWYAKSTLKAPEIVRAPSWSWMAFDGRIRILKPASASWARGFGQCVFIDREPAQLPSGAAPLENVHLLPASILKISGARVVRMKCRAEAADTTQLVQQWLMNAFGAFGGGEDSDGSDSKANFDGGGDGPDSGPLMYLPKLIDKAVEDIIGSRTVAPRLMLCFGALDCICGIAKFDAEDNELVEKDINCLIVGEETAKKGAWFRGSDETMHKTYHLLVLEEVESSSPNTNMSTEAPKMYRRVGVAQAIWTGGIGSPLHWQAEVGNILIV